MAEVILLDNGNRGASSDQNPRALLDINDLRVEIPGSQGPLAVLNGVDLHLRSGEALGIVGESGSGKSMTAMAILGLLPPTASILSGTIEFEGTDLLQLDQCSLRQIRGGRIGTILQDPTASLNPVLRIGAQVAEPLAIHTDLTRRRARPRVIELLQEVGIEHASQRYRDYPHQFSGGMRQRIVGASAISCEPGLIIADEPTTALDVTIQARYLDLLEKLQTDLDAALLFISHDLAVIGRLCQRVAVMYGGRVVETASTSELFTNPKHPYTIGLIGCLPSMTDIGVRLTPIEGQPPNPADLPQGCPFAPRCPAREDRCEVRPPEPVRVAPGHTVACVRADEGFTFSDLWPPQTSSRRVATTRPRRSASSDGLAPERHDRTIDHVIKLENVTKTFVSASTLLGAPKSTVKAVDDVTIAMKAGTALSLVGQSGSGKTTCARIALGLEEPTEGHVLFESRDVHTLSRKDRRRYRRSLQAVFQDPFSSFNPRMSLGRAVAEPLLELEPETSTQDRLDRSAEVLKQVGLDPKRVLKAYPHQLSGGQRQRVAIARALVTQPACLVLDEPVSALDVSIRLQVMNLLKDIQDQTGLGYLMISHDLASVKYLSDEVAVMYQGRIVEHGTALQIYEDPQHEYTKKLLADALLIPRSQANHSTINTSLRG